MKRHQAARIFDSGTPPTPRCQANSMTKNGALDADPAAEEAEATGKNAPATTAPIVGMRWRSGPDT